MSPVFPRWSPGVSPIKNHQPSPFALANNVSMLPQFSLSVRQTHICRFPLPLNPHLFLHFQLPVAISDRRSLPVLLP